MTKIIGQIGCAIMGGCIGWYFGVVGVIFLFGLMLYLLGKDERGLKRNGTTNTKSKA